MSAHYDASSVCGRSGGWEGKTHKGRSTSRHRDLALKDDIRWGTRLFLACFFVPSPGGLAVQSQQLGQAHTYKGHQGGAGAGADYEGPSSSRGRGLAIMARNKGMGRKSRIKRQPVMAMYFQGTMLVGTLTPGRGLEHSEPLHVFPDLTETLSAGWSAFRSAETAGGR
ncbi:hypothetical protein BN1723_008621 [Verticillium longisporum]|uniref:Uncharacterized protein n=1 Tax=Verticillium longisporum TaxID=100787 RepID=A0A0G4KHA3_VERLO|nr:hypothetical protein BN1723_008621 [Verticillium longisporum]